MRTPTKCDNGNINGSQSVNAARLHGELLNRNQQLTSLRNQEIMQLERNIKIAYVQKDRQAQIAEQQANLQAVNIQQRIVREIEQCRDAEITKREQSKIIQCKRRNVEVQSVLQQQIMEKEYERRLQEISDRIYRKILIEADRLRGEREKNEMKKKKLEYGKQLLLEMLLLQETREINMQKMEEANLVESVKNEMYVESIIKRTNKLKTLREKARKQREDAIQVVANIMLQLQTQREEQRNKLLEIMSQEVKHDSKVEAAEAEIRFYEKMRGLSKDLVDQINFENECKRRFLEREKAFADSIMAKVMESEKIEQLSLQAKRQRRLEYRKELEHMMRERARVREEELIALRNYFAMEHLLDTVEYENAKKDRMVILEQHLNAIRDYINKSTLYSEERQALERSSTANKA